jgi:dihydroflavonol-4-reductase
MTERVLVTGATGFIAQHCILQLLEAGYQVRATARSHGRTGEIADILAPHLSPAARDRLAPDFDVVVADLTSDDGWDDAATDCAYVLHVASPLPSRLPKDENELIVPARDGALRVLRAASHAGVRRTVMTSSIAAVMYGRDRDHRFDESDWSDVDDPKIGAYEKSKTLAERAAWAFMTSLGATSPMDLAIINPGVVLGPLLSKEWSTSGELVKKLLERSVPAIPDVHFAMADVRDVAKAHVAAMTNPDAGGQRFLCCTNGHSLMEVAKILSSVYAVRGYRVPTRPLPKALLRVVAIYDEQARLVLDEVGRPVDVDNGKIRRVLGIEPRDIREMTIAMAESMIKYGVVTPHR